MNYKSIIAAAAFAALPMTAFATGVAIDDGMTMIGSGETSEQSFLAVSSGGAGDFRHTFTLDAAGTGDALVTINLTTLGQFDNMVARWLNAADNSVLAEVDLNNPVVTTLSTTFSDPTTLSQVFTIVWTDSPVKGTAGFDGSITVSTVPVPAGLLLMGTALAGLGMTRRKKA